MYVEKKQYLCTRKLNFKEQTHGLSRSVAHLSEAVQRCDIIINEPNDGLIVFDILVR